MPKKKFQHNPPTGPDGTRWLWGILLLLAASYLLRLFVDTGTPTPLSYSGFKQAVKKGQVAEVTMKGNRIFGVYRSSETDADRSRKDERSAPSPSSESFSTVKPAMDDPDLISLLENNDVTIKAEVERGSWLSALLVGVLPWVLIIGLMVYSSRRMQKNMGGGGPGGLFGFGRSKAKRITREQVDLTYDDVAGLENTKKELREIVAYLKSPGRFEALGAELPKGILLVGPPGVGKTMMARATAGEADVSFFSISGSEFIEMFVGVGASRVRDLFKNAKKHVPSVIFVDEIDSIGRVRGTGVGGGHDEREQTLNQILNEMDGFSPRESVIVLAATNRPDVLDPALTRPGRFDRRITLDLPSKESRLKILEIHTRNVPLDDGVALAGIAERTVGMSGADLKNLVNEAALLAARQKREKVHADHFEAARDKILMGIEREDVVSDEEKKVIAYHEAGHAMVAKLIPEADPLQKVTIIPRGQALGATEQVPVEDRRNLGESYLLSRLAVMLGGRVAERMTFGEVSTGAGNDLKRATQLARRMVCEWGMSEKLGPVTFEVEETPPFLGRKLSDSNSFSEHTARLIDQQVQELLFDQEKRAEQLLQENRTQLGELVDALLDHEVVDNQEIERILSMENRKKASA